LPGVVESWGRSAEKKAAKNPCPDRARLLRHRLRRMRLRRKLR
jgi:hypothetical protein